MNSKNMNRVLILLLSPVGIIMGLLSIKGYTQKMEPFLWLLFGIITALVLSRNTDNKTFLHALFIGLFWGVLNGVTHSVFFDQYLANNTNLQERFKQSTFIQPRYFVLVTGPVIGLITGLVLGGLVLLFKKIGV
jgi:hypothetical protein